MKKLCLCIFFISAAASSQERIALIIGNNDYRHIESLSKPVDEAKRMKEALEGLFIPFKSKDVEVLTNAAYGEMVGAVDRVVQRISRSPSNEVLVLFHFSGHGVQFDDESGEQYLLGVDSMAEGDTGRRLKETSVSTRYIFDAFGNHGSAKQVEFAIFIDACRNDPRRGLAIRPIQGVSQISTARLNNPPPNSIVAYSASTGQTAADGLFTPLLLEKIDQRKSLATILSDINNEVRGRESSQRCQVQISAGNIYLAGAPIKGGLKGYVEVLSGTLEIGDRRYPIDSFYLAETEFTKKEFSLFLEDYHRNDSEVAGNKRPVDSVTWLDAVKYCNTLNQLKGYDRVYSVYGSEVTINEGARGYRLPTRNEWLWAYSAGRDPANRTEYPPGRFDSPETFAWYRDNSRIKSNDVKSKDPNELGIFDMAGNVAEWCWDGPPGAAGKRYALGGNFMSSAKWLTFDKNVNGPSFDKLKHKDYRTGFRLVFVP